MNNPYETPKSDLLDSSKVNKQAKSFLWILICYITYEVLAWIVVPVINRMLVGWFNFSVDNLNISCTFDLINSLLVFILCILLFSKISSRSAKLLSITTAVVGELIFLIELGGLDHVGNSGLPLWYDLVSFVKYPFFAVVAIYATKTFNRCYA